MVQWLQRGDFIKMEIRPAVPADAAVCAYIHKRSWVFAYGHCLSMELINKIHTNREVMWKKFFANENSGNYAMVLDGKMIGILTIAAARDKDLPANTGELIGLYLDPDHIGCGFGRHAMDWAKRKLKARKFSTMVLWVLDRNDSAKAFYEKCGFRPDGAVKPSGLEDRLEERYICTL